MNSRVALALAISAGMALVVSGIFYQVAVRGRSSAPEPVEMGELVVAARDLGIGAAIEATDLKVQPWPANRVPDGSFQQIEDVISRVTVSRVLVNEPIVDRRLAVPGSGVGLAPKVPEGMRAMAVRVDDVNGVAGFVLPEARVDVLLTGSPSNRADLGHMTRTILSKVRVIAAGEHLAPDSSGRPQRVPVVTLLLTPRQAELLTLASSRAGFSLYFATPWTSSNSKPRGWERGSCSWSPLAAGSCPSPRLLLKSYAWSRLRRSKSSAVVAVPSSLSVRRSCPSGAPPRGRGHARRLCFAVGETQ